MSLVLMYGFGQKKEIHDKIQQVTSLEYALPYRQRTPQKNDNLAEIRDLYNNYYKVYFYNKYPQSIKLLVHFKDINGDWQKGGFYR